MWGKSKGGDIGRERWGEREVGESWGGRVGWERERLRG